LAERDAWQFQFVVDPPPTVRRLPELGEGARLETESRNLPVGTSIQTTGAAFTLESTTITGPYVVCSARTPSDLPDLDFAFDGRVLVIRSVRRFPRGPSEGEVVAEFVDAPSDTDFRVVDHVPSGQTAWYYTTLFGDSVTGKMTFSPVFGHSRVIALTNAAVDGEPTSRFGDRAYDLLPAWFRKIDAENELSMYRICQVFGRIFDGFWDELVVHRDTMFDLDRMDAARLPYVDWMLAWPTNFELSESARRRETAAAVGFWKQKGTHGALSALVELLTGYQAEVYEGWRWVATTSVVPFDPLVEPADWDESADGVWASIVSSTPLQATFDSTNPDLPRNIGEFNDLLVYTPSTEVVDGAVGVPWRPQNTNGLLVVLRPVVGVTGAVSETLTRKVARFLPLFLGHYHAIGLTVSGFDEEMWRAFAYDDYLGFAVSVSVEESVEVDYEHFATVPDFGTFTTFPHPEFPVMGFVGSPHFRMPSAVVEWTGEELRRQLAAVTTGATRVGLVY